MDAEQRHTLNRFDIEHGESLRMPAGSKLLGVDWVDGGARLYAMTDPRVPKVVRRVQMLKTGLELIGDGWEFAGTLKAPRKQVWHVFLSVG